MARRSRRALRLLVVGTGLLALAVATLPWWMPPAVSWLGPRWGLHVGASSSQGWGGVSWRDVEIERDGLRVTIDSLETPALGLWPRPEGAELRAAGAVVSVFPRAVPSPEPREATPLSVLRDVAKVWQSLEQWLPPTRLEGLVFETAAGPRIRFNTVHWDGTRLEASGPWPGRDVPVVLQASRPEADSLRIEARSAQDEARVVVVVSGGAETARAEARLSWLGNEATASAVFGAESWLPREARAEAPALSVDASRLGLRGYGPVRGGVVASWDGRQSAVRAALKAEPLGDAPALPPVELNLRGEGDLDTVRVEELHLLAPGASAQLSQPLGIDLSTGRPQSPARFTLQADLASLPWTLEGLSGVLEGDAEVLTGDTPEANEIDFEIAGRGLAWRSAAVEALHLRGRWNAPALRIDTLELRLPAGGSVQATGHADLKTRSIQDGRVAAELTGEALSAFAPAAARFGQISLEAGFSGPFDRIEHRGQLQVRRATPLPDQTLEAEVSWEGEAMAAVSARGEVRSSLGMALPFAGRLSLPSPGSLAIVLEELAWRDGLGEWWHVTQPATLAMEKAAGAGAAVPGWEVQGLRLEGEEISLQLDGEVRWPRSGRVALALRAFDPARLGGLLPEAWRRLKVDRVEGTAAWDQGPVALSGTVQARHELANAGTFGVEAELRTEGGKLFVGNIRVRDQQSGEVFLGRGRIALHLAGGGEGFSWHLPAGGEIALQLDSTPNPGFWDSISQLTGWGITEPRLRLDISGTVDAPRGRVEVAAGQLALKQGLAGPGVQMPVLQSPELVIVADDEGLGFTRAQFAVDQNWLLISARAPWEWWHHWRDGGTPDWRGASFSVAAAPMPLSVISQVVPTTLASEGMVSLDIAHEPKTGFSGRFWLHQAALRPIQPVGAVREIDGEVTMDGYAASLTRLSAQLGGRQLEVRGNFELPRRGGEPDFDLQLQSAGVPLVRLPGLVMRAGLDLQLEKRAGAPAHIGGSVAFDKSLVVADLVSLLSNVGSGVASAERRPPYFSVTAEPFADWTLDVAVTGDEFLRVEAPLMRGTFSADLKLVGTLEEPQAIGRLWSNSGNVTFPFASLAVEQAEVSLSASNPYEPQLIATGGTRVFGYDVRMEVSGPLESPDLLFSSDPPMTSQSIFLMLSTGALPAGEFARSGTARAQRFGMFVGRNLAAGLGVGGGGSGVGDRLVVRSGENFTEAGRETMHVQLDLDGRWSLFGEYDRFDAYNGGIKFRLIDR